MSIFRVVCILIIAALLSACAITGIRQGPTVPVFKGDNKTIDQFTADKASCQTQAAQNTGWSPEQGTQKMWTDAGIGTLIGTAAGAIIGGALGVPGYGAAAGAAAGASGGLTFGAGTAANDMHTAQQRYNMEYLECMDSHGHKIPHLTVIQR